MISWTALGYGAYKGYGLYKSTFGAVTRAATAVAETAQAAAEGIETAAVALGETAQVAATEVVESVQSATDAVQQAITTDPDGVVNEIVRRHGEDVLMEDLTEQEKSAIEKAHEDKKQKASTLFSSIIFGVTFLGGIAFFRNLPVNN